MKITSYEQAVAIRNNKLAMEKKILEIAKTDPDRAKTLSLALTTASANADNIINDWLWANKKNIALAPDVKPVEYTNAIKKIKKARLPLKDQDNNIPSNKERIDSIIKSDITKYPDTEIRNPEGKKKKSRDYRNFLNY